jgi:ribosome-associated heat shock protein Hsp15
MRDDRQRLDKWIWFARFARTRTAAQGLIEAGRVRIAGQRVTTPSHPVKIGDVLTVAAPHQTSVVRIVSLGERRGDAQSVLELYETLP